MNLKNGTVSVDFVFKIWPIWKRETIDLFCLTLYLRVKLRRWFWTLKLRRLVWFADVLQMRSKPYDPVNCPIQLHAKSDCLHVSYNHTWYTSANFEVSVLKKKIYIYISIYFFYFTLRVYICFEKYKPCPVSPLLIKWTTPI